MILIIDFGSQMTHLIGRRLRQIGIKYQFTQPENALGTITNHNYTGIILSGGPASVYMDDAPKIDPQIFKMQIPILGICYGWQLMALLLGGSVESSAHEYGPEQIDILPEVQAFNQFLPSKFTVFMSHGDSVVKFPSGFKTFASTQKVTYAGVIDFKRKFIGLQFHPEADHTEYGLEFLRYFAQDFCDEKINQFKLNPNQIIADARQQVGNKKVICAVSGGVDSTVAAFLIGKAIGKNLIPVYIDSGLMRPKTTEYVREIFTKYIQANLVVIEAKEKFLKALKGEIDPEKKRKIVGKLYIELFNQEAKKHKDVEFLGQGTIYSDVIESKGSKHASSIKSHHNVGGLPKDMQLKLIEPIRQFYKDEVRELGKILGLPVKITKQHPFPGPGYAVRIRGEVTVQRLQQEKLADQIVMQEIIRANLYDQVFQIFPVLTGAFSTAVKGDARAFAEVIAIRAYESRDVMTAGWAHLPYAVLQTISSRIVNEVPDISRVVYDITSKPPATMEWE